MNSPGELQDAAMAARHTAEQQAASVDQGSTLGRVAETAADVAMSGVGELVGSALGAVAEGIGAVASGTASVVGAILGGILDS